MQPNEDVQILSKLKKRRPKSSTRFPKKLPTYIVAFALKETYDDLITAQQMICNKKSPQESTNSITPTNSLKIFESEQTVKLDQILDAPETKNDEESDVTENNKSNASEFNDLNIETKNISQEENMSYNDSNDTLQGVSNENVPLKISSTENIDPNVPEVHSVEIEINDLSQEETMSYNDSNGILQEAPNESVPLKISSTENIDPDVPEEIEINDINLEENINYNHGDNVLTEVPNECNVIQNIEEVRQPVVIFNASNYGQKYKQNKFLKKKCNAHKNIKFKHNKFKCKLPKNTISNRLEKFYDKAKRNSVNSGHIQDGFSNISTVVSRTRVLKKVLARENLLAETELISVIHDSKLNENNYESICLHPSIAKNESLVFNSNENTLTRKPSTTSSKNENNCSVSTVESVIKISPECLTPYKRDVINVAVAVAYKKSKVNSTDDSTCIPNQEPLTSTEKPFSTTMTNLTSSVPSEFRKLAAIEPSYSNNISNATLVNLKSSFGTSSDEDRYDMARTSSELNELSNTSTVTLNVRNDLEKVKEVINNGMMYIENTNKKKQTLLQTVINLGYYPEITPSTSSGGGFSSLENVIITENMSETYAINARKKLDDCSRGTMNTSVLKKTFLELTGSPTNKNVNLPNETHINAMLTNNGLQQKRCTDESKLYPANVSDLWDKLIVVLDVGFKRLEESVTEKIVKELKRTINTNDLHQQPATELDMDLEKGDNMAAVEPAVDDKVISVQELKEKTNQCLQCDLVQNQVIDQIMLKISNQGTKLIDSRSSIKSQSRVKNKTFRDYFEVLKPPAVESPRVLADKGDTVTISTINEGVSGTRRLRMLFFAPLSFVKENVFIITSVPAFFVILLFVYSLLMLIAKPT